MAGNLQDLAYRPGDFIGVLMGDLGLGKDCLILVWVQVLLGNDHHKMPSPAHKIRQGLDQSLWINVIENPYFVAGFRHLLLQDNGTVLQY